MVEIVLAAVFFFIMLIALVLFFSRYKSTLPYHKKTQADCVDVLRRGINGELPEYEWHVFIGMRIQDNERLDYLREQCALIDECEVKGTRLINGRHCVAFSKKGISQLELLLDEWQHKSEFLI